MTIVSTRLALLQYPMWIKQKNIGIILNNVRSMSQQAVTKSTNNRNPLSTMMESGSKGSFVNLG